MKRLSILIAITVLTSGCTIRESMGHRHDYDRDLKDSKGNTQLEVYNNIDEVIPAPTDSKLHVEKSFFYTVNQSDSATAKKLEDRLSDAGYAYDKMGKSTFNVVTRDWFDHPNHVLLKIESHSKSHHVVIHLEDMNENLLPLSTLEDSVFDGLSHQ